MEDHVRALIEQARLEFVRRPYPGRLARVRDLLRQIDNGVDILLEQLHAQIEE